jgi:hypothetical protein
MDWKPLYRELRTLNWIILLILSLAAFTFWGRPEGAGVFAGGLIIIANFSLLQRTISRAFFPDGGMKRVRAAIIVKYYLRLLALGVILYLMISKGHVDPVGLAVGLSTLSLSIAIMGIQKAIRIRNEGAI